MAVQLILKNSNVADRRPTANQLSNGEIALNYNAAGAFLTCRDTNGSIQQVGGVKVSETAPSTPAKQTLWLKPSTGTLSIYSGSSWVAVGAVTSVNGQAGAVTLTSADIGLGNVNNTTDLNKPISTATQNALNTKADLVGGKVPTSQLPSLAVSEYLGPAANQAAMLLLSGERGDWCIRTDSSSTFVLVSDGGSSIGDWQELATPASPVSSVNGYTGTVVLGASDVSAATTAQGVLADSALQTGDNISELTNDENYINSAGAPVQSVNTQTAAVVLGAADVGAVNLTGDNMTGDLTLGTDKITLEATDGSASFLGEIGIGVATPQAKLDVNGTRNYDPTANPVPADFDIKFTSGTAALSIGQADGTPCIQGQGSGTTYRVCINPLVGNVGIGTSNPQAKLDVNGDASINSLTIGRGAGNVSNNTAAGYQALYNNTTGTSNTAAGYQALYNNTTGTNNTAAGYQALYANTTSTSNTAAGYLALRFNTTGDNNTAAGYQALYSNTTGINNVANGHQALYSNTTGSSNTANGLQALRANTTGNSNTANGLQALYSNTTGGSNTSTGYQALYSNTTGNSNTANGLQALYSNTTGIQNTANGLRALYSNTTGINNVANGREALYSNTTGNSNTANGLQALRANTTGFQNTANGLSALYSNTTGYNNTAAGYQALYSNIDGAQNTANGLQALYSNTTGNYNAANGYKALRSNTEGSYNAANGLNALYSNTTGSSNTANGYAALYSNTTGSGNIGIGFVNNAGTYAPVFDPTTENNRLVLGHTAITNAYVKVAWTVTSDERDKMNFAPVPHGLDFVNQLKPTAYRFKVGRDTETPNGDVRYGFKAQDILALEGDNPVIIDTEDPDHLKYKGEHLVPVLVNAVQELTSMVKELQAEIRALKGA